MSRIRSHTISYCQKWQQAKILASYKHEEGSGFWNQRDK